MGGASLGVAVPNFWFGMILVLFLALGLQWFPATGFVSPTEDFSAALWYATLPALALCTNGIAEVARQLRGSLVEIQSSQHVRTLHAKGLSPARILWKHGLKNVSVNLLTVVGLLFNKILAATVVVEAVFAIPGIGSSIVNAVLQGTSGGAGRRARHGGNGDSGEPVHRSGLHRARPEDSRMNATVSSPSAPAPTSRAWPGACSAGCVATRAPP